MKEFLFTVLLSAAGLSVGWFIGTVGMVFFHRYHKDDLRLTFKDIMMAFIIIDFAALFLAAIIHVIKSF